ncbi:MAG: hypothetical protein AMJ92_03970 [candidate division Zixibacteria bacterium SM23_81]|nr:MAG: hypothetical protein AMJ92_03970 [candidate division Zixibacteria bacterium SM23_81]
MAIARKYILSVYEKSSVPIQNLFSSTFGLRRCFLERRADLKTRLADLLETQWLDTASLKKIQSQKLRKLVKYAYEEIPFYRRLFDRHGLRPGQIRDLSDLPKIPLLSKEQVKSHRDLLCAPAFPKKKVLHQATSGTTGSPLKLALNHSVLLAEWAWIWRHRTWGGYDLRTTWRAKSWRATFGGHPIVPFEQKKPPFWRYNFPGKQIHFSTYHMTRPNLSVYVEKLKAQKVRVIDGYPSTIFILAKFLRSTGERLPMAAIFTGAEPLYFNQRQVIEEALQCRVSDYYGLTEKVASAGECERHDGLHVTMEDTIVEIISEGGRHTDGSKGEIVGTSLVNYAMPLLRYKTGDVSEYRAETCPCGRGLVLIEPVQTKVEDIITTEDGRFISASNLTYAFKPLSHIHESQIIQENVDRVTVKIVAEDSFSDDDGALLLRGLREKLGSQMHIEIKRVDQIPRTSTGKFRFTISKVPFEL